MNAWIRPLVLALSLNGALTPARAQDATPATTPTPPEIQAVLAAEKGRLERFFSGEGFNYFALEMKLREVLPKLDALMARGDHAAAQQALAPLAALLPLDDIPHIGLAMRRARLLHEARQTAEATTQTLRYVLLERAVVGERDALSEATAIEVPFVEFEYFWLARRGLKREAQRLQQGERSYDVLDVTDREGRRSTLYFDVTRLVKLRLDGINRAKS